MQTQEYEFRKERDALREQIKGEKAKCEEYERKLRWRNIDKLKNHVIELRELIQELEELCPAAVHVRAALMRVVNEVLEQIEEMEISETERIELEEKYQEEQRQERVKEELDKCEAEEQRTKRRVEHEQPGATRVHGPAESTTEEGAAGPARSTAAMGMPRWQMPRARRFSSPSPSRGPRDGGGRARLQERARLDAEIVYRSTGQERPSAMPHMRERTWIRRHDHHFLR